MKFAALTVSLIAAVAIPRAAQADPSLHRTVLDVRFAGLSVGKATFDISIDGSRYEMKLNGRTTGVADVFAPGRGEVESAGEARPELILASTNRTHYSGKDENSTLNMEFRDGEVTKVKLETTKPRKKLGKKWVPVQPEHLRSVVDPASAIVISVEPARANDPRAVCDRTLNIYDGDARYDMKLSYKKTLPVNTKGYKGYAYVCKLKYIPIAGHKTGQRNIEYMQKNDGIELWVAPIAKSPVYTVIRVEVPTWLGTVSAMPAYFGSVTK
ncbi:MAG: DUF3108 domain-containing protein [Rhizobiaceae bacterium]